MKNVHANVVQGIQIANERSTERKNLLSLLFLYFAALRAALYLTCGKRRELTENEEEMTRKEQAVIRRTDLSRGQRTATRTERRDWEDIKQTGKLSIIQKKEQVNVKKWRMM